MKEIKRGEIYSADFGVGFGSEQGGVRPVLILQNNTGCRATLSDSRKQHFIIASFSRKKAQSHLNDTVMPLFLHFLSSMPGY